MRFMIIHKSNEANEAGLPPSPELVEGVGKLLEEAAAQGVLLAGEGVHASARGARISYRGGSFTVTDGPFAEARELIAGFVIIDVASKQEAVAWSKRYAQVLGDVDIEIRQVVDLSDFDAQ